MFTDEPNRRTPDEFSPDGHPKKGDAPKKAKGKKKGGLSRAVSNAETSAERELRIGERLSAMKSARDKASAEMKKSVINRQGSYRQSQLCRRPEGSAERRSGGP